MDEIAALIEILSSIIFRCEKPLTKEFIQSIERFKNLQRIKEYIDLEHKDHTNSVLQLAVCDKYHCLECLVSKIKAGCCSHGCDFSQYDKYLITKLAEELPLLSDEKIAHNKCNVCKAKFEYKSTLKRACRCQICDICLLNRYDNRDIKCKICDGEIEEDNLRETALLYNKENFELFDNCKQCMIAYSKSCLLDGVCFMCLEIRKFKPQ